MLKPITIVGGGLAGLSLGIGLRRRDVPVTVIEAGRYPRHRVCGEFVSGRGQAALAGWGLDKKFVAAGAREASSAAFFSRRVRGNPVGLPMPALCLSRYVMDAILAREFESLGGRLHSNCRWEQGYGEGIVRATGRRRSPVFNGWRWFGLKVHAHNVQMAADLEMHMLQNGYVGLCRLGGGSVNVCGLFRARVPVPDLARNWTDWLRGGADSQLRQRLDGAHFEGGSFCSVGGLVVEAQSAAGRSECCIGDAISMMAPLTGNGMSMAFESAQLAVAPLANYSRQEIAWDEMRGELACQCDRAFRGRLKWSRRLQQIFFRKSLADGLCIATRWPALWRNMFRRTR